MVPVGHGSASSSIASGVQAATAHPDGSAPPNPFFTDMAATLALGAPNLTTVWAAAPPNASSFIPDPELSCADAAGNIWVPDYAGNRVLEFHSPFTFAESASVFLGQSSATGYLPNSTQSGLDGPGACTVDPQGDLWVSDYGNSRVLEYTPPFTTGMNAALVLGQSTFTGDLGATSAHNLTLPIGLRFDPKGDLWVADAGNNRVVEFVPPFSSGMAASLVLGQGSFLGSASGRTATNLTYPMDIAYSAGVLWVADAGNGRVVGFSAPFSPGEGATYLLGETSFTSFGATGAAGLAEPESVSFDARGDLWVSDYLSSRVLEYLPPLSISEDASVVIGQPDFTSTGCGLSAKALCFPLGAFVAPNGALWVTDASNCRVLEYLPAAYHLTFHVTGLATGTNWNVTVAGTAHSGSGVNITLSEENGSYDWNVPILPGYAFTPHSGTAIVNGTGVTVSLTATRVTYTVTFTPLGLPAPTNWSVTLGGGTLSSVSNGSISFSEANGTYSFVVLNVPGYTITPLHGSVVVNGVNTSVHVGFAAVSSSSSSLFSTAVWIGLVVVGLAVGLVVGLLVGRRRKGGSSPSAGPPPPGSTPPPASTGPEAPPSGSGPPPGASG